MRLIKGSIADKIGASYCPNPTTLNLKIIGDEWTDILKNPRKYQSNKLY